MRPMLFSKFRSWPYWLLLLGIALIGAACTVTVPFLPASGTPTPTPAPTVDAQAEWARIQQKGELVVGTSSDYPPFAYYDDRFRLTGFDPALARAVGERLGLTVQIKDVAFDQLQDALNSGDIDVALGALNITPDREEVVDFSDVYLISVDAFLVNSGIDIPSERTLNDFTKGKRIGVQAGSVFQSWLEETLVQPGILPKENLILYDDIEQAVRDLRLNRVDMVVMDVIPAQRYVERGGVKIAAQGLNRLRFAMAVRNGSDDLRRNLNTALIDMQNSGAILDLAGQYLGVKTSGTPRPTATSTPPPTATPQPTPTNTRAPTNTPTRQPTATPTSGPVVQPTATPPPATATPFVCTDSMNWVADLSYDDRNMTAPPSLSPGQSFVKGWRVRNSGSCTWNSSYRLDYVTGNSPSARMGGQASYVQGVVPPGATYDFYVAQVAPLNPGVYQGFWQLMNPNDRPFGARVWVGISVPSPVTLTPTPTPTSFATPTPWVTFYADRTNILAGDAVTFYWDVRNIKEVYFYAQSDDWWRNGVAGVSNRTVYPQVTTSYYLRIVRMDSTVEIREIVIYVQPAIGAPKIVRFTANPDELVLGECTTLRWDVQGTVNYVLLTRNGETLWSGAPALGNLRDCPNDDGEIDYRIEARGPGGISRDLETVDVNRGPSNTATPTATPSPTPTSNDIPAVISQFSTTPAQIQVGQCVTINWSVTGNPTVVQIFRNQAPLVGNATANGTRQDCVSQVGVYIYRIEATNAIGRITDARESSVVVLAATTATPTATPTQTPTGSVIDYFTSSTNDLNLGDCLLLSWSFQGNGQSSGQITRNGEVLLIDPPAVGTQYDCPVATGLMTYTLEVSVGANAPVTATTVANVVDLASPTPTPTEAAVQPPVIDSFTVDNESVTAGQCAVLTWQYSGDNIASAVLLRNDVEIAANLPPTGTQQECYPDADTFIYDLVIERTDGASAKAELIVMVQ